MTWNPEEIYGSYWQNMHTRTQFIRFIRCISDEFSINLTFCKLALNIIWLVCRLAWLVCRLTRLAATPSESLPWAPSFDCKPDKLPISEAPFSCSATVCTASSTARAGSRARPRRIFCWAESQDPSGAVHVTANGSAFFAEAASAFAIASLLMSGTA